MIEGINNPTSSTDLLASALSAQSTVQENAQLDRTSFLPPKEDTTATQDTVNISSAGRELINSDRLDTNAEADRINQARDDEAAKDSAEQSEIDRNQEFSDSENFEPTRA